jgi:hypothetical protein
MLTGISLACTGPVKAKAKGIWHLELASSCVLSCQKLVWNGVPCMFIVVEFVDVFHNMLSFHVYS